MKHCLKCQNAYDGHGGKRCCLDGLPVDYNNKCIFPKILKDWKSQAKKAGYWLNASKMEAMT